MRFSKFKVLFIFFVGALVSVSAVDSLCYAFGIECKEGIDGNTNGNTKGIEASLINSHSFYPESPFFSKEKLSYVEYSQNRVMVWNGQTNSLFWGQQGCGPAAITETLGGEYLVACYNSNQLVRLSDQGEWKEQYAIPAPNDFARDSFGGIYVTSSSIDGGFSQLDPPSGAVFYWASQEPLRRVEGIRPLHYANGIAVSPDGKTLFVAETLLNRILKYSILSPGVLDPSFEVLTDLRSEFPLNPELVSGLLGPDGIRVNSEGILFVAQFAGSRVLKIKPDGSRLGVINIHSQLPGVSFSNTTNIWVENNSLFVSAGQDKPKENYPGIIFKLTDPLLSSRSQLDCFIY